MFLWGNKIIDTAIRYETFTSEYFECLVFYIDNKQGVEVYERENKKGKKYKKEKEEKQK